MRALPKLFYTLFPFQLIHPFWFHRIDMASSASTSRIGYTADGTPMPSMPPVTRADAPSLPPLLPMTDRPQPASTVRTPAPPTHAAVSSDVPIPMAGTSYHAYLAGSDDDDERDDASGEDDNVASDVPPSTRTQNNGAASKDDDEDTAEEEQLFRVPQPTSEPEKEDAVTVAPLADTTTPTAKDGEGTTAPTAKCANKTDTVASPEVSPPSPESSPSTDSFYMRVARFLLGVIVVMVIGYMVYWVIVNVFGIDLLEWTTTTTTDTPSTDTAAPSSTNSSTTTPPSSDVSSVYPPSPNTPPVAHSGETPAGVMEVATGDGRVLRKQLTDTTAAALLDMMTSVKRG